MPTGTVDMLIVEHLNEIEVHLGIAQTHVRELREILSAPQIAFSENAVAKATPYLAPEFWNGVLGNAI